MGFFPNTGSGSGIGRAACSILSREGASIIAVDKNLESAKQTIKLLDRNSKSHAFEIDISSNDSIRSGLREILNKFQTPPSIIVNAAGITKDNFLLKMDENDFDDVIRVNLKASANFLLTVF